MKKRLAALLWRMVWRLEGLSPELIQGRVIFDPKLRDGPPLSVAEFSKLLDGECQGLKREMIEEFKKLPKEK